MPFATWRSLCHKDALFPTDMKSQPDYTILPPVPLPLLTRIGIYDKEEQAVHHVVSSRCSLMIIKALVMKYLWCLVSANSLHHLLIRGWRSAAVCLATFIRLIKSPRRRLMWFHSRSSPSLRAVTVGFAKWEPISEEHKAVLALRGNAFFTRRRYLKPGWKPPASSNKREHVCGSCGTFRCDRPLTPRLHYLQQCRAAIQDLLLSVWMITRGWWRREGSQ